MMFVFVVMAQLTRVISERKSEGDRAYAVERETLLTQLSEARARHEVRCLGLT